jgi:4-hydroxybenzoate polyprenyltransferase
MAAWLANATPTLLVLPAAAMALQVVRLNTSDPAGCLALFKFNRETGLLVLPALLATRW